MTLRHRSLRTLLGASLAMASFGASALGETRLVRERAPVAVGSGAWTLPHPPQDERGDGLPDATVTVN